MPNWAYNRIYAKNKDDFEKIKECFVNKDEVDFNLICPMPKVLDNIPADSHGLDYIAAAIGDGDPVDRIMVCAHIREKYPQVVFTSHGNPVDVTLDGSIVDQTTDTKSTTVFFDMTIVDQIAVKSKALDKNRIANDDKRVLSEPKSSFNHGLTWKQLGNRCLKALIECGHLNWYDWAIANWGTKWNACSSSIDEEDFAIYFETAWSPADNIVRMLSEKAGVLIYMEYSEEQFSAFAGECVFGNGEIIETTDPAEGYDLYRIAAHMQDPDEGYYRYSEEYGIICNDDWHDDDDDDDRPKFEDVPCQDSLESDMYKSMLAGDFDMELEDRTAQ